MGNIRLTAETKQQIEEAKKAYIELKNTALAYEAKTGLGTLDAAREAQEKAFEAYTAFTHTLREAYGPSWSIAGSPENEAYRKVLRQVEKSVSNKSHEASDVGAVQASKYHSRLNSAPGGRSGGFGRDS